MLHPTCSVHSPSCLAALAHLQPSVLEVEGDGVPRLVQRVQPHLVLQPLPPGLRTQLLSEFCLIFREINSKRRFKSKIRDYTLIPQYEGQLITCRLISARPGLTRPSARLTCSTVAEAGSPGRLATARPPLHITISTCGICNSSLLGTVVEWTVLGTGQVAAGQRSVYTVPPP